MKPPRLVLFAARWAIMSGLAGTVFALLVFTDDQRGASPRGMLLASAAFLAIAFMLAPFVRHAFIGPSPVKRTAPRRQTLLDEMRSEGESRTDAQPTAESADAPRTSSIAARLLIGLYVVFAAALAAVLWAM